MVPGVVPDKPWPQYVVHSQPSGILCHCFAPQRCSLPPMPLFSLPFHVSYGGVGGSVPVSRGVTVVRQIRLRRSRAR
ncbi:hypothetical protein DPMN_014758 [Dreissena polymorpha]|uniref:Uncharacterized protein n=1 Tax=Dreissena polymorpha TaxID=45954 RepID=A0A9D4N6K9_DREPO|nr:hypothetical protein DPMN_014758 [Dreissena polymorpha]